MIKKHQKEEFLDQVTNVVVNFFKKKELAATGTPKDDSQDFSIVDWFRGCDTLSPVDELKGDFEEFFRNCQLPTAISPSGRMTGACRRKDNFCYPE